MAKDVVGNVIEKVIEGVLNNPLVENIKKYIDSDEVKKAVEDIKDLFTKDDGNKTENEKENL